MKSGIPSRIIFPLGMTSKVRGCFARRQKYSGTSTPARGAARGCQMAQAVLDQAVDPDGGLALRSRPERVIDPGKEWWPQAEAVVGFLNAYQLSGLEHFRQAAERSWEFIEKYIVDRQHGEWFWKVSREGLPSPDNVQSRPMEMPVP